MSDTANSVPNHVGFIFDGNRRWAKERGLSASEGHMAGYKAFKGVATACFEAGVKYVSIYVFSTENWKRDETEIATLMKILLLAIHKETKWLIKNGIRLRFIGRRDRFSDSILKAMRKVEAATAELTQGTIAVCLDYGGQQEIADAARTCIEDGLSANQITPEALQARLYAPEIPPVDMVVRTSGEQRLSNFMLWRAAYSELLFIKKYWPEMTKADVTAIIETYGHRSRRFGG